MPGGRPFCTLTFIREEFSHPRRGSCHCSCPSLSVTAVQKGTCGCANPGRRQREARRMAPCLLLWPQEHCRRVNFQPSPDPRHAHLGWTWELRGGIITTESPLPRIGRQMAPVVSSCSQDAPGGPEVKTWRSQGRGLGSIPDQGTRAHMPRRKMGHAAATKTGGRQIN